MAGPSDETRHWTLMSSSRSTTMLAAVETLIPMAQHRGLAQVFAALYYATCIPFNLLRTEHTTVYGIMADARPGELALAVSGE